MAMFPRPHISTVNAIVKTLLLNVSVGILAQLSGARVDQEATYAIKVYPYSPALTL